MARRRKPKNLKGTNNRITEAMDAEPKESNCNEELAEGATTQPSQNDEVWDLTRVIPKSESVICRFDGCNQFAVATWASNLKPDDIWNMCIDCQEKDFGGWPEGVTPPLDDEEDSTSASGKATVETSCGKATENPVISPPEKLSPPVEHEQVKADASRGGDVDVVVDTIDDDGSAEIWHLKRVLSVEEITKECPIKCSTEECPLPACCVWISSKAPKSNWYSCLDCQLKDFEGWPPLEDMPIEAMTVDHEIAIASKCSRSKSPAMPKFPVTAANLTPLPNSLCDSSKLGSYVTPSPAAVVPPKPSAAALAAHKKWQDEAEVLNGPGARLVVSKPDAKKLIADVLHDAFRPMTMADIHKALRALVPTPVLRSCLQDMTLDKADVEDQFFDSDEEGDQRKTAAKSDRKSLADPYAGSLAFKAGKGANSVLYYTDYSKLQNNGNGLDFDQRGELVSKLAKVQAEEAELKMRLDEVLAETTKLLSEPTNEQLIPQLECEEPVVAALMEKVESARMLKVNEKHRKQTQKRIDNMVAHWRKRKRLCMDFLIAMEESTEGVVSVKKCLSGSGQIDIDSDEVVNAGILAFRKKKNTAINRKGEPAKKKPKLKGSAANGTTVSGKDENLSVKADDSFVAVKLDVHGSVCRVYVDDE